MTEMDKLAHLPAPDELKRAKHSGYPLKPPVSSIVKIKSPA